MYTYANNIYLTMSRIEAYRHMEEDRPYVNCASTVVHALSPRTPLEQHSRAMINDAARSLYDVAAAIALEHARVGNCVVIEPMLADTQPSDFFRRAEKRATQSGKGIFFIGGLMVTQEGDIRHVIGILNHHRGRHNMYSVCDTARLGSRPIIRRMKYREMDTRLISPEIFRGHRAMALLGRSLRSVEHDPESRGHFHEVDLEIQSAGIVVQNCLYRSGFQYLLHED
jgi:hypothetical protein